MRSQVLRLASCFAAAPLLSLAIATVLLQRNMISANPIPGEVIGMTEWIHRPADWGHDLADTWHEPRIGWRAVSQNGRAQLIDGAWDYNGDSGWREPIRREAGIAVQEAGWPCRAHWYAMGTVIEIDYSDVSTQGAVPSDFIISRPNTGLIARLPMMPWSIHPPTLQPYLPGRVHWPELLVNVLVLGTAAYLAVEATFAARALARHSRGRCRRCGYPMASSPCPECGSAPEKAAS